MTEKQITMVCNQCMERCAAGSTWPPDLAEFVSLVSESGANPFSLTSDAVMAEYKRWRNESYRYSGSDKFPWQQPVLYHICVEMRRTGVERRMRAHENIQVFYRRQPTYNPQFTHGHERKTSKRKTVNSECYGKARELTEYDSTSRYPRDVQFCSSDKQTGNFHPTQKPLALVKYLIETYSKPGDVVLDFTMGSGTCGVACQETGRVFIGIEKETPIYLTACQRMGIKQEHAA